ncbi:MULTISPECIES: hypothetical protein [Bacteroides]|jgi:hypothetical protein|uniref:hypothetical protein n=1 Tax=Bacteroides TaxID=816 RepID=UPI00216ABFBE|nr:hypothetical protein [Bacteroides uniformis]
MERYKTYILTALFALCLTTTGRAQAVSVDPVLTGMILEFTQKAKSQYKSQEEMMALQTTGHIWLKEEVDKARKCQEEFDKYLSTFRSILGYAAQTYGFYYEINNLSNNMGRLTDQIGSSPTNAIAVALHQRRNDIYVDIINLSVGIVNNIRQVCLDNKMTEKQRIELVFSIRPKLKDMNHKLVLLTKLVKHTNLAMVWYEIEHRALPHEGRAGIIEEGFERWRLSSKSVKVRH